MSPNKTLYIREEDMPLWKRADEVAEKLKISTSQLVTWAVRLLLQPKSPKDLKVFVPGEVDDVTFSDSDGAPLLIFQSYPPYGVGWVLHTDDDDGMDFIGGDLDEVASAIATAQDRIKANALPEENFEEIKVEVGEHALTIGFTGRWLVEPDGDETRTGEDGYDAGAYWGVALTKRGRIAVYTAHCNERWPAKLEDFDSLDEAGLPADILALAAEQLGEKRIIWRDI